jgi:hypothetical protein
MRHISTIAGLLCFVSTASAQGAGGSIDAGALSMRYADSVNASGIAVTPAFWTESRLSSLAASGTLTQFSAGGWSAQGSTSASLFTPRIGPLLGEIEGGAGGSTHKDGARTGQLLGTGRLHLAGRNSGIWLGGGLGSTWDGDAWRNVRQAEAAGWTRFGSASAFVSATPVVVDDSIRYTDAEVAGSINLARFELGGSAGFRSGNRLPTLGGTAKSWGSVSATGWIANHIAIVGSAGTYPVDLTQGFPGGRFASLGIRLGARRFPPATSAVSEIDDLPATTAPRRGAAGITRFETRNVAGRTREIRILAPSATQLDLMGDFTGWKPVALRKSADGWWTVSLPITPGIHEMNARMDGGRWVTPPGLAVKSDEFGGSVAILVIR